MRREMPLLLVLAATIGLIGLLWLVFPDALLGVAAETAEEAARATAAEEIGEALFQSFFAAIIAALVLGLAWSFAPGLGRRRVWDDAGALSRRWHWAAALGLVWVFAIGAFFWLKSGMQGVPDGWLRTDISYGVLALSVSSAGLVLVSVTRWFSAPHMRPSIPWGVSRGPNAVRRPRRGAQPPRAAHPAAAPAQREPAQ
jgi:hypothetical protein